MVKIEIQIEKREKFINTCAEIIKGYCKEHGSSCGTECIFLEQTTHKCKLQQVNRYGDSIPPEDWEV